MEQSFTKQLSLPAVVTVPLAALLVAVIIGAAMLVAGTLRFFMFPLGLPLTTAVVAVSIAAWLGGLVWQTTGSRRAKTDDDNG